MRLLHTKTLEFKEYFDHDIPNYTILSHRWGSVDEEVSYTDFISSAKKTTPGYHKILAFCELSREHADYCWIDTCCIDKSSSAELTEAINSMYGWYERAHLCFAYLKDVSVVEDLAHSDWFNRGWTLQELIAPKNIVFLDAQWRSIGTRTDFKHLISQASKINERLLTRDDYLHDFSVAQIMSWAAHRITTRVEDRAYSLMGLFGVNMPLLYGEGEGAFRRLQEHIMDRGGDDSLFAWGEASTYFEDLIDQATTVFAPSPRSFQACGNISKGFSTRRILFETTSRGLMVSIHLEYDPETLKTLLNGQVEMSSRFNITGLTIPLGCFRPHQQSRDEFFYLSLAYFSGSWHRIGVVSQFESHFREILYASHTSLHSPAYSNEYVRIYVDYHRGLTNPITMTHAREVNYLHLRDSTFNGLNI